MFRLILTLLVFATSVFAQVLGGGPLLCATQISALPLVRSEGVAEKVGDVIINCSGGAPGSDAPITVTVTLNTAITSRVLSPASNLLETVLLVDDLATAPQVGTNVIQAALANANQLVFNNVPIHLGRTTSYRIANLRADASSAPGEGIYALIVLGGVQLQNQAVTLGLKAPGVNFSIQAPDGTRLQTLSFGAGSGYPLMHRLKFGEGFATSFRKRNTATSLAAPAALSDQNVPSTDYHTESGLYLSTLPSANGLNEAGLATQGTRLVARFSNVPPGVSLYVTTAALPLMGSASAVLTAADNSGAGPYAAVAQTGTVPFGGETIGIVPVALAGGSGTATWEVLDDDPAALESYRFGLIAVSTNAGTATVVGGIGPVSALNIASSTAPVPRFADTSAQVAACAASQCFTAAPGAIAIAYQTGAAAPSPIALEVGSSAGPLPFTAAATATPAGWLSVSPLSGVTPATLTVTINPASLSPGVYEGSIVLRSDGPTSTVPVLVTVTASGVVTPLGCTANVANPTQVRGTGMTELLGDITLACTGGTPTLAGANVPTVDVKVVLSAPITSRTYANGWSEVLLLVDEPNSGYPGPSNPLLACNDPSGSCAVAGTGNGVGTYNGTAGHPNVFPGKVSGNTVTFPNFPLDPPGAGGVVVGPGQTIRVLRLVNLRTDATGLPQSQPGILPLLATVSAGPVAVTNPLLTAGFLFSDVVFSLRSADNTAVSAGWTMNQCAVSGPQRVGVLRFAEGFAAAFKMRTLAPFVDPQTSPAPQAQNVPGQFVPGAESAFYTPGLSSPAVDFATVGLANFATRLRARIDNVPNGARVFVSTQRVVFSNGIASVPTTGAVARLVANESSAFAAAPVAATLDGIAAAELSVSGGSASAVWEILRADPILFETVDFLVWVQPGSAGASPATVNGSLGPAPPAFADSGAHTASSTLPWPRFTAPAAPRDLFSVTAGCSLTFNTPAVLPDGVTFVNYSLPLSVSGGSAPYSFAVTGGALPAGITLGSKGLLSGAATSAAGNFTFTVTVTDSVGGHVAQTFTLHIAVGPPAWGIVKTHSGNFTAGQADAVYTILITNPVTAFGSSMNGSVVSVNERPPSGLVLTSMVGAGWTCGLADCWRNDTLAPGSSYPPISVHVAVASNAPAQVTNQAYVSGGGLLAATVQDPTTISGVALRFVPVSPCRIADTRNAAGAFGGPQLAGGASRDFAISAGPCGIPAAAQAYSLNVAVVPAGPLGYLTLWPSGQTQPVASTLNALDGRVKSNAAIVPAGAGGAVSVFASNATHVILDIVGYFVPATDTTALAFYPVAPCRVADTRSGASISGGQTRSFPVVAAGGCNIPASARAYSLNLAVIPKGPLGYLTAWAGGQPQPVVASLNALTGTVTANAVIVPAGSGGDINVFASNPTDLVIDINGYFAPGAIGGLSLYSVTPCRVLDSRQPSGAPPFSSKRDVGVAGDACAIPAAAEAYVFGATVVPVGALGYLTLWPQGQAQPTVSTLNALDAAVTSNMSIVPAAGGAISAFPSNPAHLILDIFGYFAP